MWKRTRRRKRGTMPEILALKDARTSRGGASKGGTRAGSLDYDECTSPFVLGRKLEQGLDLGIRIRASRALGEFGVTESLGNNGF